MPLQKAPQAPEPQEFASLVDYVGSAIALQFTGTKVQNTDYGDQKVYIVNVITPDGNLETGLYCFWRDVQRQLDEAEDWIAGVIRKEEMGKVSRYVLDASMISPDDFAGLVEAIESYDADDGDVPF